MKSLAHVAVALCGLLAVGASFAGAQTPPFASTYSWSSTGPLISAKNGYIAVKDPSAVLYNGRWVIYASTVNSAGSYGMEYLNVAEDWSDAATATPTYLKLGGTAPQVFYFAPQNKWYLISQWGTSYSTNSDPTEPLNWSTQQSINVQMPSGVTGIDFWVICDSTNCYLFFCGDNGSFYRASTPIGNFPNGWGTVQVVASDSEFAMFEADNVYTVEGGGYLANIEALGSTGRYFRALWANSLGGTWYDLGDTASFSTPFLGINNTTFESGVSAWTTSFSSGGMLIDGNDQTDSINPNNLAFLYQGASQQAYQNDSYGAIPWQLGVAYSKANTTVCTPTAIVPYISVAGVWSAAGESTVSVASGTAVNLGPWPETGGSWSWTGPNGFTSTSREIDNIALSAGANVYTATYTNSCGSKSTQAFTITVTSSTGSFSLKPSASTLSVAQSSSGTDTITVTDVSPFSGSVAFTASGMPSGVTAAFSPTSSTTSSVLTLTASSTATTGAFTITVTGTSGSTTATTTFTLTVTAASCTPTAIVPYLYTASTGWVQEASISVASGTAVNLGPQPSSGGSWAWTGPNGFTSTSREIDGIALSTGANVYTATYTNSCGGKSTQAFTITVTSSTGSFSLKPSSSSLSVTQGASGTDTITVTDVSPFSGSVTLAASGLPSGVTAAFATNPATSTSVLTLTASSSAATGSSTVTITGTSGSLSATTTIALTVSTSGGGSACEVDYTISPQTSSAFGAAVTIKNGGTTALSNWTLTWSFANGQTIASSWNGTASQSGANVTVSEQSGQTWENIPAGGSYSGFGFNGTWNGTTNAIPTAFSLNGTACTVN
jgi:endo-1,4-beta-xylanase